MLYVKNLRDVRDYYFTNIDPDSYRQSISRVEFLFPTARHDYESQYIPSLRKMKKEPEFPKTRSRICLYSPPAQKEIEVFSETTVSLLSRRNSIKWPLRGTINIIRRYTIH